MIVQDNTVKNLDNILEQHSPLILDGALATQLEAAGFGLDHPLWSAKLLIDHPQAIEKVHRAYVIAGANVLTSASYQLSYAGGASVGLSKNQVHELFQTSIRLARNAAQFAQQPIWIAGSLGPYGAFLHNGSEYHGRYSISSEELVQFHGPRIACMVDQNPDVLAFETIPSLSEAKALAYCTQHLPAGCAWISFSCRNGIETGFGDSIRDCATWVESCPQWGGIGLNCTHPQWISSLIDEIRGVSSKPIVVYPNSGEIWDSSKKAWSGTFDMAKFLDLAMQWRQQGATIIGGCCRTTPETINALAKRFETKNQ